MIGYVEQPDYVGLESVQENYDPSFGFLLQKSARLGFRDTSLSLLASMQRMADAEKEGKIDRKQWEDSEFYDERIQYDDSFTYAKARLLKQRFDMEDEYAYYLRQAQGTDYIAGVGGLILGSIPDPINFIPMLGALSKPMRVLRYAGLSQRMARGTLGAADAAIASTLVSPLLMSERATYQQKYDAQDALIDIGLATGIGFAFGSVLGRVRPDDSFPPSRIPTPEEVAEGLEGSLKDDVARMIGADEPVLKTEAPVKKAPRRKNKVQDAIETVPPENRAAAVAKAINQIGRGEPVNVAAEMQPVVLPDDVRQFQEIELQLNQTTPEFRQWFSGSKVISKSGAPMRMYHGSPSGDIEMFGPYNFGLFGEGYYFTTNPDVASTYAKKGSPTVYPVFLSIKNPMNMDQAVAYQRWRRMFANDPELLAEVLPKKKPAHIKTNENAFKEVVDWYARDNTPDYEVGEALREAFKKEGIDGLTHKGGGRVKKGSTPHRVFIAFEPDQIKFAYSKGIKDFDALDAQTAKDLKNALAEIADEKPDEILDDFVLDYTVARTEDPVPLVDEVIEAVEKQTDAELDYELNQAIEQGRFTDEEVMRFMADDDLTSEQSQKELTEFFSNLGYCVLNNG